MAKVGKDFRDTVALAAGQFDITIDTARKMVQGDWRRAAASRPGLRLRVKLVELDLEIFNGFLS